jgi:hypothetical protein
LPFDGSSETTCSKAPAAAVLQGGRADDRAERRDAGGARDEAEQVNLFHRAVISTPALGGG